MVWAPHRSNILATVLLPVATPPVRPTRIMGREHTMGVQSSQRRQIDFSPCPAL
jgi:hypothetical protein